MNKPKGKDQHAGEPGDRYPKSEERPKESVDTSAHTEHAMPAVPPMDTPEDEIPEDQRETHPIIENTKEAIEKAKTEHDMAAIEPTMSFPIGDPSILPPPKVSLMPSLPPPSINVKPADGELEKLKPVNRPVAVVTNERGTSTETTIPLFTNFNSDYYEGNDEYEPGTRFFAIGTDPSCDVYFKKSDNPCIKPKHGVIKLENGKIYVRAHGKEGIVRVNKTPAVTWREIENPETDLIEIVPKKNNQGTKLVTPRYLKLDSEHLNIEEEDRKLMVETLRRRATSIIREMNRMSKALLNEDTEYVAETDKTIQNLGLLLQEIVDYDTDNDYFALGAHGAFIMQFFELIGNAKDRIQRNLKEVREIDGIRAEIETRRKAIEEAKKAEERKACKKWEVEEIHYAPGEDLEKVPHVFRCPVYTIKKNHNMTSEPLPMLIPSMDIGTHKVCHIELEENSGVEPNRKNRIAPFAGKLFYQDEGGEPVFYFQYFQSNILIKGPETTAKKVPPPSETFRVTEGMSIFIGGYELKIDSRMHGFTYGLIKDEVLGVPGNPGIVDELFECIEDQGVTTWKQDKEAIKYLQTIIEDIEKSKLSEEEKNQFRDKYRETYEKIAADLLEKIEKEWSVLNPTPDSSLFQTLCLFAESEDGYAKSAQVLHAPDQTLRHQAARRFDEYTEAHQAAEAPQETKKTLFSRFRRGDKKTPKSMPSQVDSMAALEVARFLDFELIEEDQIEGLGPFTARVKKIRKVREHFQRLDEDRSDLDEILELAALCNDLRLSDVFAAEEIETRKLHIEVQEMSIEAKAHEYLQKICVFQARKAFKRLKGSSDAQSIRADVALITGLCAMKIMHMYELIDNVNEFIPKEEIDDILSRKREENPEASDEQLKNELKTQEVQDLMSNKEEALKQAEKAREQMKEDLNQAVKNAAIIYSQNVKARNKGMTFELLAEMMPMAQEVFNIGFPKVMDDNTYDLRVGKIVYESGERLAMATPTTKKWPQIFKEWTCRLQTGCSRVGKKALSSGENLREVADLIEHAFVKGYIEGEFFEDLLAELRRASKAQKYRSAALAQDATNFDYLEKTPSHRFSTPEDKDFYESVKNEITAEKLSHMLERFRLGDAKDRFKCAMKIKQLQRKAPIAVEILQRMDLSAEEQDLLQQGA